MPNPTELIHKALGSIAIRPAGYAYLGKGDGSGVIVADANNRLLYYYTPNQPTATAPLIDTINILAYNRPELENARVRLGYPPEKPNVLHIVGIDQGEGLNSVKGITPEEQMIAAQRYSDIGSLINFRLSPNDPVDSEVYINPGWYLDNDGLPAWWNGDTTDTLLAAAIAALSAGTHQMAVTCVEAATNAPAIFTNTAAAGGVGDKQVFDTTTIVEMVIPNGYLLAGAVHLYYGQTLITEDDIYRASDPRIVFQRTGGGDSGFPITVDTPLTIAANRRVTTSGLVNTTSTLTILGALRIL